MSTAAKRATEVPEKKGEPTSMEDVNLDERPFQYRSILIPIDGTHESEYVVDWAINNFYREGDQMHLLHVIPKRYPTATYYAFEEYVPDMPDPEQEASWRADAEKYIQQKLAPVLSASKVPFITDVVAYETDTSSVGEVVCEKAVEVDAAAVIMASHGKGRLKEFFIGSVTNYCLHRCKKPVIICRKPADHFIAAHHRAQRAT